MGPNAICPSAPPGSGREWTMCPTPLAETRQYLANFRKVREVLNEICAINAELLRRREPLSK